MTTSRLRWRALVAAAAGTALVAGCTTADESEGGGPDVVATFYPLAYVAERVAGEAAAVTDLTPPGTEPHDLELTPRQVGGVAEADLVISLEGFQPAVDEAIAQNASGEVLNVAEVVPLETRSGDAAGGAREVVDSHVWLDPDHMATITDSVAERLSDVDPDNAEGYRERSDALVADLERLDQDYRDGLAGCRADTFVTRHAAFGYLADRYDLREVALTPTPEDEPSPGRLADVERVVRDERLTTLFVEPLADSRSTEALAADLGVATDVLDPIETKPEDGDYLTAMEDNLRALRGALSCP